MPPDSVPDVLPFVQPPNLSYRPIRAAIAAALEEGIAAELTGDVCILVACIAAGTQLELLSLLDVAPTAERDLLSDLAATQNLYGAEIQAMRAITDTLIAAGLALGFPPALVDQRIRDKQRRELWSFPD